ncbi:MAG: Hint domain-containing protein [Pseudomonadota bacterium]
MVAASELAITTTADAAQMAEAIFDENSVEVLGATYSGDEGSSGIYTGGNGTSLGVVPGETGIILSTGLVTDFTNTTGEANQNTNTSTDTTAGIDADPLFDAAAGANTFDASFLDVRFIPDGNVLTMRFVFASDEYPEFQNSIYQDFVGVWVNDQPVDLVVGDGDTDPGNINSGNNQNLFIDNADSDFNTEMDGFTVTMTLSMNVNAGVENRIRIGIADVADSNFDSSLLIAGNSLQTDLVATTDDITFFASGTETVDLTANDVSNSGGTLEITHINGTPVSVGSEVLLATGQRVRIDDLGIITLIGDGDVEDFNFTYTVTDGTNIDTGFVTASAVPCFVAGTLIRTPDGEVPIEDLAPGDLVETRDDGPCPIRWIGSRRVQARGDLAPIHIGAGALGPHGDVHVSPQHRILLQNSLAQLLFGEDEVLVAARDLVNDRTITRREGGDVTYFHMMFDAHQVVFSDGLETESFLPGPQTVSLFEQRTLDEICNIFPELDPHTGAGYGAAARRTLRRFEAQVLVSQGAVA